MQELKINEIEIGMRRAIDPTKALAVAESIKDIGLLNPITVDKHYRLIAGAHRLEAFKILGRESIECNVVDLCGLYSELAEIDENLMRNELHWVEQGDQLRRRKEIYEELHPETRNNDARYSLNDNLSLRESEGRNGKSEREQSSLLKTQPKKQAKALGILHCLFNALWIY